MKSKHFTSSILKHKSIILPLSFLLTTAAIMLPFYIGSIVLILHFIFLIVIDRKKIITQIKELGWILGFIIYTLIISVINRNMIGVAVSFALFLFSVYFSIYIKHLDAKLYIRLLKTISVGSLLVSIYNIFTYVVYIIRNDESLFYMLQTSNPQYRAEATFFNANYYGLFCIFAIVISLYLMTKTKHKRTYTLYGIVIVGNMISILMTASRMLLPTMLLSAFVMVYFINRKFALRLLLVGLIGIVIIILNPALFPRFESLAYGFEDRFGLWNTGWQIFLTKPLTGRGPLSYINYYYLFINETDMHAHQLLIDSLANYGLIGIFLLMNAFIPYFRTLFKSLVNKIHSIRNELGLVLAMITAVLTHGLMDVSIFWLQTGFIFLIVILCPIDVMEEVNTHNIQKEFK